MSDPNFDPYHKWLGISPKDQPANHYRLLSIDLFESDPDVIDSAAQRQISHVRTFALGPYSEQSQSLLNELSLARVTLLNPQTRAQYDAELRKQMPGASEPAVEAHPETSAAGSADLEERSRKLEQFAAQLKSRENLLAQRQAEAEARINKLASDFEESQKSSLRDLRQREQELATRGREVEQRHVELNHLQGKQKQREQELERETERIKAEQQYLGELKGQVQTFQKHQNEKEKELNKSRELLQSERVRLAKHEQEIRRRQSVLDQALNASSEKEKELEEQEFAIRTAQEDLEKEMNLRTAEIHRKQDELEESIKSQSEASLAQQQLRNELEQAKIAYAAEQKAKTLELQEQERRIQEKSDAIRQSMLEHARNQKLLDREIQEFKSAKRSSQQQELELTRQREQLESDSGKLADERTRLEQQQESLQRQQQRLADLKETEHETCLTEADPHPPEAEPPTGRRSTLAASGREHAESSQSIAVSFLKRNKVFVGIAAMLGFLLCITLILTGSKAKPVNDLSAEEQDVTSPDAKITQDDITQDDTDTAIAEVAGDESSSGPVGDGAAVSGGLPGGMGGGARRTEPTQEAGNSFPTGEPVATMDLPPADTSFDADKAKEYQEIWANKLGVPVELTNSIDMKFRLVPPGTCQMWFREDNGPAQRGTVTVSKAFMLGTYEVTQAEYELVMDVNPSRFKGANLPVDGGPADNGKPIKGADGRYLWDPSEFIKRLNALPAERNARRAYRLPTDVEWGWACLAGSPGPTHFFYEHLHYSHFDELIPKYGWVDANSEGTTHPVGLLEPNPWGFFDMYGNVFETLSDCPRFPRGGSWNMPSRWCYHFGKMSPSDYSQYGIRVVLEIE